MSTTSHMSASARLASPNGALATPINLLLRPPDAAKALAISERKLWQLTRDGEIACVRSGRAVRYAVVDLQAWIDANRQGGSGE